MSSLGNCGCFAAQKPPHRLWLDGFCLGLLAIASGSDALGANPAGAMPAAKMPAAVKMVRSTDIDESMNKGKTDSMKGMEKMAPDAAGSVTPKPEADPPGERRKLLVERLLATPEQARYMASIWHAQLVPDS